MDLHDPAQGPVEKHAQPPTTELILAPIVDQYVLNDLPVTDKVNDPSSTSVTDDEDDPKRYSTWTVIKFVAYFAAKGGLVLVPFGLLACLIVGLEDSFFSIPFGKVIVVLGLPPSQYPELRSQTTFWAWMFFMVGFVAMIAVTTQGVTLSIGFERMEHRAKDLVFRKVIHQDVEVRNFHETQMLGQECLLGVPRPDSLPEPAPETPDSHLFFQHTVLTT